MNGKLIGHISDGKGFVMACEEREWHIQNQKIVVLGAGGAACAIIVEMALQGAKAVSYTHLLEILKQYPVDFISFSYYQSRCASANPKMGMTDGNVVKSVKNPYLQTSDWGWQIDPLGPFSYTQLDVYKRQVN